MRRARIRRRISSGTRRRRINDRGWTLEMRIPFSSLRYRNVDPQTWGILLYRNYPRDRHYQFFSAKLPRGSNCFVCRSNIADGLEHLPAGGHLVAAPYVSASERRAPARRTSASPLGRRSASSRTSASTSSTRRTPTTRSTSRSSRTSRRSSPTRRRSRRTSASRCSFRRSGRSFSKGVDLFQTPIQAVYTRTITRRGWGGRVTGKDGGVRYTALVAEEPAAAA